MTAVTSFALDGNPADWGDTEWLKIEPNGRIAGCLIDPTGWQTSDNN
jgi:hypothetical protein